MKTFKQFLIESYNEEEENGEMESPDKKKKKEAPEQEESGEEESNGFDTALDVGQQVLAVAGAADPTQILDATNTGISLVRGLFSGNPERKKQHYVNAGLLGASMIPGIGDAAKVGMFGPKMAKILANPNVAKIMQSRGLIQLAGTAGTAARARMSNGSSSY